MSGKIMGRQNHVQNQGSKPSLWLPLGAFSGYRRSQNRLAGVCGQFNGGLMALWRGVSNGVDRFSARVSVLTFFKRQKKMRTDTTRSGVSPSIGVINAWAFGMGYQGGLND